MLDSWTPLAQYVPIGPAGRRSYVCPPAYGTSSHSVTVEPSSASPSTKLPSGRPSAVRWPGEASKRAGGETDRARWHGARGARRNGDGAVHAHRSVDELHPVRALRPHVDLELVRVVGLGEHENPQPFEGPIEGELLRLVEIT